MNRIVTFALVLLALLSLSAPRCGAAEEVAQQGRLVATEVHGASLAGNPLGFSPDRDVLIYLPPSYDSRPQQRYPVVYVLHGITDPVTVWTEAWTEDEDYGTLPHLMDRGVAAGLLQEMILVMLDGRTPFYGSHYVNSTVKGDWTDYISQELVAYVDSHYRTLARPESRGIMGHSMGGHGAIRLGLEHPDVFSVVYGLNPSLLGWGGDVSADNPAFELLLSSDDPSEHFDSNFYVPAIIGVSQAFSPNPDRPPFFADYPFKMENGEVVPNEPAHSRWEAHFPTNRIDAYLAQPLRLRGVRFDSAFVDEFTHIPPTSRAFSEALSAKGVAHTFEMYNGDHRNRLWGADGRLYTEVLPFFSRLLVGEAEG